MRTICYKIIFGRYEISAITEGEGNEITVKFENSIDGILALANTSFKIANGICKINADALCKGEIVPKLYTATGTVKIEGFLYKNGAILRHAPDADYIRELAKRVNMLEEKTSVLEASYAEIQNRMTQKIEL